MSRKGLTIKELEFLRKAGFEEVFIGYWSTPKRKLGDTVVSLEAYHYPYNNLPNEGWYVKLYMENSEWVCNNGEVPIPVLFVNHECLRTALNMLSDAWKSLQEGTGNMLEEVLDTRKRKSENRRKEP